MEKQQAVVRFGAGLPGSGSPGVRKLQIVILLGGWPLEKRQVLILFGRGLPVSGSLRVGI